MKPLHFVIFVNTVLVVSTVQDNYYESFPPYNFQDNYQPRPVSNQQQSYQLSEGVYSGNDFSNGLLDLPDPNVPRTIRVLIPQPYPVHVNVEQPVQIPVYRVVPQIIEKPVPYTVEKPFPVEIKKLYPVEVLKKVEVTVPKPYPVPYTIYKHIVVEEQTYKLQAKQDGVEDDTTSAEDIGVKEEPIKDGLGNM